MWTQAAWCTSSLTFSFSSPFARFMIPHSLPLGIFQPSPPGCLKPHSLLTLFTILVLGAGCQRLATRGIWRSERTPLPHPQPSTTGRKRPTCWRGMEADSLSGFSPGLRRKRVDKWGDTFFPLESWHPETHFVWSHDSPPEHTAFVSPLHPPFFTCLLAQPALSTPKLLSM